MSAADSDPSALAGDATDDHDTHQRSKPSYDDVNVPYVLVVGFVSAVLTFVCICGVQAIFYYFQYREITIKDHEIVRTPQTAIIDEQKAKLQTYGHTVQRIDTAEGTAELTRITIPIDHAIEMTLTEEAAEQAAASTADNATRNNTSAGGSTAGDDNDAPSGGP